MKLRTLCLLLGAGLLAGCWQKSLNAFYTPGDVISDGKLARAWREKKVNSEGKEEPGQIWTFTESGDKSYKVEIKDGDESHHYEAHLFKLDDHRLLDLMPTERTVSTIPAHNLFRVTEIETNLQLARLSIDWMQKWLRQHPASLAHIAVIDPDHRDDRENDELVLTAETKALQKFLREHWNDADFFADTVTFGQN
ncbi:MAG TPA: hypothetical protein VGF13_10630 [Verrucomicrobiae bacterium]|jgi:hypothetical protein